MIKKLKQQIMPVLDLFLLYYHAQSLKQLIKCVKDDIVVTLFMQSGTGILSEIVRGVYFQLFLKYKWPALFGKGLRIINYSNIKLGKMIWIKNDVTLFAGGPLVIGNNCVISERVSIWSGPEGVYMGNNTSLGIGSYIAALKGKVVIEDEVRIADCVRIYSWNHEYKNTSLTIAEQGRTSKGVKIGRNCWIGSGATILDGVILGESCVVGAGAVVTKSFDSYNVIGGVPAKVIKKFI